ncbi:hypothetical protein BZA77DRAFT_343340 [Pyronema omphalodes]|nr:hypothetical protein BZA77DRAFT_343340 [Pyronema omphalodes]
MNFSIGSCRTTSLRSVLPETREILRTLVVDMSVHPGTRLADGGCSHYHRRAGCLLSKRAWKVPRRRMAIAVKPFELSRMPQSLSASIMLLTNLQGSIKRWPPSMLMIAEVDCGGWRLVSQDPERTPHDFRPPPAVGYKPNIFRRLDLLSPMYYLRILEDSMDVQDHVTSTRCSLPHRLRLLPNLVRPFWSGVSFIDGLYTIGPSSGIAAVCRRTSWHQISIRRRILSSLATTTAMLSDEIGAQGQHNLPAFAPISKPSLQQVARLVCSLPLPLDLDGTTNIQWAKDTDDEHKCTIACPSPDLVFYYEILKTIRQQH